MHVKRREQLATKHTLDKHMPRTCTSMIKFACKITWNAWLRSPREPHPEYQPRPSGSTARTLQIYREHICIHYAYLMTTNRWLLRPLTDSRVKYYILSLLSNRIRCLAAATRCGRHAEYAEFVAWIFRQANETKRFSNIETSEIKFPSIIKYVILCIYIEKAK